MTNEELITKGTIEGYKQVIDSLKFKMGILALYIPTPYKNGYYHCPFCFGIGNHTETIDHTEFCMIKEALSYLE